VGLGLSISKRIIDDHKGMIEDISESGKGATFKIRLPV
ncbi:MAG: ATP-binding protein, partial [candidate division WOR-3 bacterium]